MNPSVLSWAQVLVRERIHRGHPSLQTQTAVSLLEGSDLEQLKIYFFTLNVNYLPDASSVVTKLTKMDPGPREICALYAGVGLMKEVQLQCRALRSNTSMDKVFDEIVKAAAVGGHWDMLMNLFFNYTRYQRSHDMTSLCARYAAIGGHWTMVQTMLAYNPKIAIPSLIESATRNGRLEVLQRLLQDSPFAPDLINILTESIYSRNVEMVRYALYLQSPGNDGLIRQTAIRAAQIEGQPSAVMALFVEKDPSLINLLLPLAIAARNVELVCYLLDRRGAINIARSGNEHAFSIEMLNAALHQALPYDFEMVKLLVSRGAYDHSGRFGAVSEAQTRFLIDARTLNLDGALRVTCGYTVKPRMVQILLEAGATDTTGALMKLLASECNYYSASIEAVDLLVAAGADVEQAVLRAFQAVSCGDSDISDPMEDWARFKPKMEYFLKNQEAALEMLRNLT